jgi:hypothetical protein
MTAKTSQAKSESAIQKFRRTYPRMDYFPDVEAHKVIQQMRLFRPGRSTRELIDALVCAGGKTYFPETSVMLKNVKVA